MIALLPLAKDIAVGALSFLATTLCIKLMFPVGGVVSSFLPVMLMRFGLRRVYGFVFDWPLHLSFLLKAVGYVVSASGALVPLLLTQYFYDSLLKKDAFVIGVLVGAINGTLVIMADVHQMKIPDFRESFRGARKYLGDVLDFSEASQTDFMRLARSHFSDLVVVRLVIIVVCYGVVTFCAAKLGLIASAPKHISLESNVESAMYFLRVVFTTPVSLSGPWGYVISGFYGLCLLIYMTFFISLSSKLIDDNLPTKEDYTSTNLDDFKKKLDEHLQQTLKKFDVERSTAVKERLLARKERVSRRAKGSSLFTGHARLVAFKRDLRK